MVRRERFKTRKCALAVGAGIALLATCTWGQDAKATYQVLYSFQGGDDGQFPLGAPAFDAAGNMYGSTSVGGKNAQCLDSAGCGTVFELSPGSGGGWTESVLVDTIGANTNPATGVIIDPSGNLYGTSGGFAPVDGGGPLGPSVAVFEVSQSNGVWSIGDLFGFGGDFVYPNSLTRDAAGNLYGTTLEGGQYNNGYAFEVSPQSGGWATNILYNFGAAGANDGTVIGPVIVDAKGNLYGAGGEGGAANKGVVFELVPLGGGAWQESILYTFTGVDGSFPVGSLAMDAAGNLYGTTITGGVKGFGVVFELSPQPGGAWAETILFNFGNKAQGFNANGSPVLDAAGNIYGTTNGGGSAYCNITESYCGVVFRLSPPASAELPWKYAVLHDFTPEQTPGPLTLDSAGNIYGFTAGGGANGLGEAYKLVP